MAKKEPSLDNLDLKILFALDRNSRTAETKLAKLLRVSREIIKYRIKKLKESGIIKSSNIIINPAKLGYIIYKVYLKLQNLSKNKEEEMLNYSMDNKNIFWIAKCDGSFDLIFAVYVKSLVEFNEVMSDFMGKFSENIFSRQISNSVYVDIYRRDYLTNQKSEKVVWGGKHEIEEIDEQMKSLLKILADNSRATIVDICKKVNSAPKTIIAKIKEMEKKGIILGYRINIDLEKVGRDYFKSLISFHNLTAEEERKFRQFCSDTPSIVYYIRNIAEWDVELDIEIENFKKFNELIREIKDKFSNIIRNIDSVFISEEMKGELNIVRNL